MSKLSDQQDQNTSKNVPGKSLEDLLRELQNVKKDKEQAAVALETAPPVTKKHLKI